MSHIEYEVRVLEINKEEIQNKLNELGATLVEDVFQRRYVYDFNPVNPNKWIRLRTNGKKTTLTIKEVVDKNKIGGTKELEVEVSDFELTNIALNELGFKHRNYQENKRAFVPNNASSMLFQMYKSPTAGDSGRQQKKETL